MILSKKEILSIPEFNYMTTYRSGDKVKYNGDYYVVNYNKYNNNIYEIFVVGKIPIECSSFEKFEPITFEDWLKNRTIHHAEKTRINNIKQSIKFMENWINTDLKELDGDTASDYAKFILNGHKHINTAIECLNLCAFEE